MASYDLRREVVVAKFQTLIDAINALDGNTDEIEAKLDSMITLLTSLDGKDYATETTLLALETTANAIETLLTTLNAKDFATETTLAAIKAKTDLLNFTGLKLRTTGEDAAGGFGDKLLQVDEVGTTTYLGYAEPGSLTSASVWAIKRIIETGNDVSITWADGNNSFDNIWDNRLALTYS